MDVSFLEPVFGAPAPYATVCADVTHTTENADNELELRVRAVTARLTDQGAPEVVIEAVRARLLEGKEGGEAGTRKGRALVVASDGSVVLDHALVDAPTRSVRTTMCGMRPGSWRRTGSRSGCGDHSAISR